MGEGGGGFLAGLAMTITAACISGFAGVYTEMLLKSSATSLWIRQIQARRDMGLAFSVCIALDSADTGKERYRLHARIDFMPTLGGEKDQGSRISERFWNSRSRIISNPKL